MRKYIFAYLLAIPIAVAATAETPLRVVATLSTYADLAEAIGGDRVDVEAVVPAKFNPHTIEPRPSDVLNLKKADLFIHTGLDLELWRGPLIDAAGNPAVRPGGARELDLSQGIRLLEVPDRALSRAEGDIHLYGNPHFWLDPRNGRIMAAAIADKLSEIDPGGEAEYRARHAAFDERLAAKIDVWQEALAAIAGREVVGYHNQWPYFMAFTGVRMKQFVEPKPGIPPSPKHLKVLTDYMGANDVGAIAYSRIFAARPVKSLAKRTGAAQVVLAQNVGELSEASDYIAMIDYNVNQLVSALR